MASLTDRAGLLVAANFIKYAVGFFLPLVLVRMLPQADYGTYQQLVLVGTAALGVATLGLPMSVYFFFHRVPAERLGTLAAQTSVALLAAGAVAATAIALVAGPLAAAFNNPSMAGLLSVYALSVVFMVASEHSVHFMIAQNRYKLAVALETIETVTRVAMILAPLAMGYGLVGVVYGAVFFALARWAVRGFWLRRTLPAGAAGGPTFLRAQLDYSLPIALVSLVTLAGVTFNRGILATAVTPQEYALYSVGALEIPLDVIFQASVANVLRASLPPLVQKGELTEVVRIVREAVRKLAIIVLPCFVFLMAFAHEFITLLFTDQYAGSVGVFRLYLLLVPLHMLILSPIPQVFGRTRVSLAIVVAMTITLVALTWLLLEGVGFYGPAIAAVAAQYIGVALYLAVVLKLLDTTLAALLPWGGMARVLAASLAGVAVAIVAPGHAGSLAGFVMAGAAFSAAYAAAALALGVLTPADRVMARRWMARALPAKKASPA